MKHPFFSIIIRTLNEEKNLPTLLAAISNQSFRNFEVLLVDAQSQDATLTVARSFEKKIPHLVIFSSSKRNLAFQSNFGASRARGEYIVFFDADNSIDRSYLDSAYKFIRKHKSSFVTSAIRADQYSSINSFLAFAANITVRFLRFTPKQFACGGFMIVKKNKFLDLGGFREDLAMSEDHELAIRLRKIACRVDFLTSPAVIVSFRRLRSEGIGVVLYKYIFATFYTMLFGPMTKRFVEYETGGQAHHK